MSLSIIQKMNEMLLTEMPEYSAQAAEIGVSGEQRRLLRALMNVRPTRPLSGEFLALQDELFSAKREARGVVDVMALPSVASDARIALWQGDITRLNADAIVNAANSALLGCFIPCHRCIDNAIHSAAGLQLRAECAALMEEQGHPEETGMAKITQGYNLPARYVIHTVGPIISGALTDRHRGRSSPPAIAPVSRLRQRMVSGASRSAASRRGSSTFQMQRQRRSPCMRCGISSRVRRPSNALFSTCSRTRIGTSTKGFYHDGIHHAHHRCAPRGGLRAHRRGRRTQHLSGL